MYPRKVYLDVDAQCMIHAQDALAQIQHAAIQRLSLVKTHLIGIGRGEDAHRLEHQRILFAKYGSLPFDRIGKDQLCFPESTLPRWCAPSATFSRKASLSVSSLAPDCERTDVTARSARKCNVNRFVSPSAPRLRVNPSRASSIALGSS